ncbi:DNA methyltransferase [Microlunatus sagamiharensis]|uniref:DNA methyltransferase n=1 Tax=Microlunatus sagamiharensis TaxID=546874 RepID=UPI0015619C7E|nr:DNA methyltransferase [Microlunatus sagamiharensis]
MPARTALEHNFPAVLISAAAQRESWRKELHRPATHTHKWWAQRLGSVFRGILTAAVTETAEQAGDAYAGPTRLDGLTVFDCFAGSGTTLVEAVKLGARAVGRDINPVAALVQRQALARWDEGLLTTAFKQVAAACQDEIERVHRSAAGEHVLYYFWVLHVACRECGDDVELFSSYVFAKHAYPARRPLAQAVCATCHDVVAVNPAEQSGFTCANGHEHATFDGPVNGRKMMCGSGHTSAVVDALDALDGHPPDASMYAKLVLTADGAREYRPIDDFDRALYEQTARLHEEHAGDLVSPVGHLESGYNTTMPLRWGYRRWEQFFNARQLYCLGLLGAAVRDLDESAEREALATLFSGTLEFNNLFCSYKGEGTGAVRHMFKHHVLQPQRTPLEAHPWGVASSSGSFSALFETRLLRAQRYKQRPDDLVSDAAGTVRRRDGLSAELDVDVVSSWAELANAARPAAYVVAGDSASTDLPDASVALIVTDPPYMDNVHYSELADFFHAWLVGVRPYPGYPQLATTRQDGEVQAVAADAFESAIRAVWVECARVLADDGLLAFTFHHARETGWTSLMSALRAAGLVVTAIQPVKAEMSSSAVKSAALVPSNLDSIVVCRKADRASSSAAVGQADVAAAGDVAVQRLLALARSGIDVSANDVGSVVRGSVLALQTRPGCPITMSELQELASAAVATATADLAASVGLRPTPVAPAGPTGP